ncbi:hypothetical protein GQR58_024951 [Nymphon striatum]|nr:hypothetical protein GQR58_024951 [Nymphon striatum]KAG1654553.1 hypothetical protein GQR58_024951 [Nymphon striatum]
MQQEDIPWPSVVEPVHSPTPPPSPAHVVAVHVESDAEERPADNHQEQRSLLPEAVDVGIMLNVLADGSVTWRCPKRTNANPYCPAMVKQRGDVFTRRPKSHNHEVVNGAEKVAVIRRAIKLLPNITNFTNDLA